jgi:hypothetical protein
MAADAPEHLVRGYEAWVPERRPPKPTGYRAHDINLAPHTRLHWVATLCPSRHYQGSEYDRNRELG